MEIILGSGLKKKMLTLLLLKPRVYFLLNSMSTRSKSVFENNEVAANLADIYDKYVVVLADKASNNVVCVCKTHYIQCFVSELGMGSNGKQNKTYQITNFSKQEILSNHKSILSSHGISFLR